VTETMDACVRPAGMQPPQAGAPLRADTDRPLTVVRPGLLDYRSAWDLQRQLVAERREGERGDVVLLLEHPPVYTLGSRADRTHILFTERELRAHGIDVIEVDRGGDVTYHGPGQLVGYPIIRLGRVRGVVDYVRALEEILIRAVATFGIHAGRSTGYTGVWVGDAKLAAIGVRVSSGGITSHGFALNVSPDLSHFSGIVPCGIRDRSVCSLASLGVDTTVDEVADRVESAMAEVLGATLQSAPLRALKAYV
jgi:lipoyl(octanoyl) transferase